MKKFQSDVSKRELLVYVVQAIFSAYFIGLALRILLVFRDIHFFPLFNCYLTLPHTYLDAMFLSVFGLFLLYQTVFKLMLKCFIVGNNVQKKSNPFAIDEKDIVFENLCDARRETIMAEMKSIRNQILTGMGIASSILILMTYLK